MKIRRLEIQGFKSFCDRTVFEFGDGITAVVGPNGCGKSNVVDAVKWALGDMSPKSLRGKRMEDVIFAGSAGRKASGLAEVTLVLDNSEGLLPTERTEVAVTRRLYRTGESEYLVNGDPGRLKDVRELFLDTGLGPEGHSIMEQGQIDALLRANAVDRRGLFEEAAGVSRYKQRKREAESKLEKTAENLERLRDVLELEEKRLRQLKVQASRARRYRELCEELKRSKVEAAVLRWRAIGAERAAVETELREVRAREEATAHELADLEGQTGRREADREALRTDAHALEASIATALGDARAAGDRAAYARRTIEDLRARIAVLETSAAEARARVVSLGPDADAADREAAESAGRAAALGADLARVDEELRALEAEAEAEKAAHDGAKRTLLDLLDRASRSRNAETERRTEARQAQARLARLGEQRTDVSARLARAEAESRELTALAATLDAASSASAASLAAAEDTLAGHVTAAEVAERRRSGLAEERAKSSERFDLLKRLAAAYEGVEGGVKDLLAEAARRPDRGGVLGLLADLVDTSTAGAHVLDRLLGHAAGAVVVRTTADAVRWLEWLRAKGLGRARLLALDLVRDAAEALPAEVGEVRGEPDVLRLVASASQGCVPVPDLAAGVAVWRSSGGVRNAVTPTGERVTASGALVGGSGAGALGLVERAAETRRLADTVRRLAADEEGARDEAAAARAAGQEVAETIRRLRLEIAQRLEDRGRHGAAVARQERERAHLFAQSAAATEEIAEQEASLKAAEEGAAVAAREAAGFEAERGAVEAQADATLATFEALEARTKEVAERRMEVRLAIADARARADAASSRAGRVRAEAAALAERANAATEEAATLSGRISAAEVEIAEAEARRRSREEAKKRDADALADARDRLEAADRGLEDARGSVGRVRAAHEELRASLDEARRREAEHRVRLDALVEQVRAEHDVDLEAAASEHVAAAGDALPADPAALEARIGELRTKIEEIGNVNLNAIAETEEAEGRVGFLKGQETDLVQAKATLEGAIEQLDGLSVTRFAETFEAVRLHFHETFRRLFGGGRADIVLENPDDVLDSGIDIVARPPGKEPRTIGLLSGGERTLTAVALLFAVFRAKPSPFAILDEVDAALDEANIRRLVAMVQEFTVKSQFLVVTHAKTTMETANVLYGVTMEEPGVSKKVAVRLGEPTAEPAAASA